MDVDTSNTLTLRLLLWPLWIAAPVLLGMGPVGSPLVDVSDKLAGFVRAEGSDGLGGAAWFDYNNDGFLDLYITNRRGHANALFRNNGDGSFTDVATPAGVANVFGNSGATAADINNDGWTDLFLTGEGSFTAGVDHSAVKLYLNNADGTFSDHTVASGIIGAGSPFAAAFGDIDDDGFLDLFLVNIGSFGLGEQPPNQLFLNNRDNTFRDISVAAGIDSALGGCVVAFSDYDTDGLTDIFVGNCNDLGFTPSRFELWRNNGDLTFTDVGREAGLGDDVFWMSVNLGDIDNDGDFDLFATNIGTFLNQSQAFLPIFPHVLYENNGNGTYMDIGQSANIDAKSEFAWGGGFADFNNDGFLDLIYSGNWPLEVRAFFPNPVPFAEPSDNIGPRVGNPGRLLINNGDKTFTLAATLGLQNRYTSGLAVGDFNNDGFSDVIIVATTTTQTTQELGAPILLQNTGNDHNWVTVRTIGTTSNRGGVGALVKVKVKSGDGMKLKQVKQVHAGSGFLSADSPWLTFGLGTSSRQKVTVKVKWPSGRIEKWKVPTRQIVPVVEGTGKRRERF